MKVFCFSYRKSKIVILWALKKKKKTDTYKTTVHLGFFLLISDTISFLSNFSEWSGNAL